MTKDVTLDNTMPSAAPQEHSKDKEDTRMEIFLASLPILAKSDSKGAYQVSSKTVAQHTKALPPGKKKKRLRTTFFFTFFHFIWQLLFWFS